MKTNPSKRHELLDTFKSFMVYLYFPIMNGISLGILDEFFSSTLKLYVGCLQMNSISKQWFYQVFNYVIFHMHYKNSSANEVNEDNYFFC
jgi:hypothetical protein